MLRERPPGCSVSSEDNHFKLKALFYSLRNHVMKIMTTNHISDKCIFPYVNNKSFLGRICAVTRAELSSPCARSVLHLTLEVASSHHPFILKKCLQGFSGLFPLSTRENTFQTIFVCEGEVRIYTRFSLCVTLPVASVY